MAAIPAANVKFVSRTTDGTTYHLIFKITGDGSGTTIVVGLSHVLAHLVGDVSETAGYNPQVTYSNAAGGATITYGAAPTSNLIHFLHLWGY